MYVVSGRTWFSKKRGLWAAIVFTISCMVYTTINYGLYEKKPHKLYTSLDGQQNWWSFIRPNRHSKAPNTELSTKPVVETSEAVNNVRIAELSTKTTVETSEAVNSVSIAEFSPQIVAENSDKKAEISPNISENVTRKKLILLWTSCYGSDSIAGWFVSTDTFQNCPFTCEFTMNRSLYNSSDALFVEGLPLTGQLPPPVHNIANQIWAFFRIESPANARIGMKWDQFESKFNWTMSYRRDSDIIWPAARFIRISGTAAGSRPRYKIPTLESLRYKKLVTWMVSNCYTLSKREHYVNILQKYIPIDIYGSCGHSRCNALNCYEEFGKTYKFWLAFENSICTDYVSEKMYRAMKAGMVPIVYAHPSFKKVAIPGSYINVFDFDTALDLANYLKYLDQNPKEYLKYFEWMKEFVIANDGESMNQSWCDVCTKLNTMDFEMGRKFYPSVGKWFNQNYTDNNFCINPVFNGDGKFNFSGLNYQRIFVGNI